MGLMTTGATAWAAGCSKADWTCALYAPVTGTKGSCGFTPNADTTFKTSTLNPYPATAYSVTGLTSTTDSANAAFT